ncbi:glycosyltransferase family 2 protein [Sneathiella sp.]|jgi:GT2 family glycosyltransferase|uniref:glycosyltransferase family 2 protein n=1 Tax=Sneathiella sp. TaxID=1964365 RepID=UPI0039E4D21A
MNPEVSVIIVSWNVKEMVLDCVRSVLAQTKATCEVIVIDNASGDGTVEAISAEFSGVRILANDKNIGFAAANNQGIEISKGDYILLLNPDTLIVDDAIDQMLEWMKKDETVGCGGCQVYEAEDVIQKTCFSDPSPWNIFLVQTGLHRLTILKKTLGKPEYSWWDRRSEMDVDVVSGMFMMVPKTVIDNIGPMDDAFFVYSEEADWCRRIRKGGYRCVFTPIAKIIHRDGGNKSTYQIRPKMYVQLQKSQLIYARKHYGLLGYILVKSLYLAAMSTRVLSFGLLSLLSANDRFKGNASLALKAIQFHLFSKEPV